MRYSDTLVGQLLCERMCAQVDIYAYEIPFLEMSRYGGWARGRGRCPICGRVVHTRVARDELGFIVIDTDAV